ncbi:MAG: adaptor protein MecA [Oscillospiraceae bacterium]|nr:adaptor protein MecA [Oscillospiraceae bacterium]
MQIDILSSNTLKLTLSRIDMFDLDIKYESLSGKNPETKRLLAHVLKSIRLDQKVGFDFSCERIFVEAFPRPDGGCMLYVSSLEADGRKRKTHFKVKPDVGNGVPDVPFNETEATFPRALNLKRDNYKSLLIIETENMNELGGICRCLSQQKEWERLSFESTLYLSSNSANKYRLVIKGSKNEQQQLSSIIKEYGEVLRGEREYMHTQEHFKPVIEENAAEKLSELL